MQNEIISSKDNPHIKQYRRLAAAKKERLAEGLFVLEGLRLVQDAIAEHAALQTLLLTEAAMTRYGDRFAQVDLKEAHTLVISNELGAKIAETTQPQGVFAICRIPAADDFTAAVRPDGHYLILNALQDPGNLGMILRTADAMGIDGVLLCGCCDVFSPKVIRATMGSVLRVPLWYGLEILPVLEQLRQVGVRSYAAVLDPDAKELRSCDFSGGSAVVIGNEGNGLPDAVADACDVRMTIRMHGHVNSLNAAMATGIILWELQGACTQEGAE